MKEVMMDGDVCFRINEPKVVHETIDGETIVLNLEKGIYYSLNDTGALVWSLIENKYSQKEVLDKMARLFGNDQKHLRNQLDTFIDNLLREELVALSKDSRSIERNDRSDMPIEDLSPDGPRYIAPEFTKYTDMKDLLLLDPIHDVDDSGWPAVKAN
jgi:hypothetical protein